ncbi:MAG: hypothetical protein ACTHM1_00880 [Solirubrobacteraceae bacterium]
MVKLLLATLVFVLALMVGSIVTFASSDGGRVDNVAATRAYLVAWHRIGLDGRRDQRAGEAKVQSLVAGVKKECSGVLANAPESRAREDIRDEILEDVALTQERPARDATLAFARAVQRLHWSNHKLTYYVSHSAREEAAKEEVALPDICADAKTFAADGFKTAPTTTEKFLANCGAANSITAIEFHAGETGDLEERIWRLLKPYERRDEKALLPHRLSKHEREQAESILKKDFGTPVFEIAHALGLPE